MVYNSNDKDIYVNIPQGQWSLLVNEKTAGIEEIIEITDAKLKVKEKAAYVLIAK